MKPYILAEKKTYSIEGANMWIEFKGTAEQCIAKHAGTRSIKLTQEFLDGAQKDIIILSDADKEAERKALLKTFVEYLKKKL